MKSLIVTKEGELDVVERPLPTYKETQSLVKIISCGICGTDEAIIQKNFKGVSKDIYPLMLGHEAVGRVIEIGQKVTSFNKGDIVLLPFNSAVKSIGSAWGGFSEYGVINDYKVIEKQNIPEEAFAQKKLPFDINPIEAPIIITLREVYSAIKYFKINRDQSVVVIGSGPVAVTFVKLLKLLGLKSLTVIVRNEEKEKLLKKSGASLVINSNKSEPIKELKKYYPQGADKVIDAVGSAEVINQGLKMIKDRGDILCYGVPKSNNMNLDWSDAPYNWNLKFQQMPYKFEEGEVTDEILNWVYSGDLDLKDFISDYIPFENVIDGFKNFKEKKILKKAIVTFE